MCICEKLQQMKKLLRTDEVSPLRDLVYHISDDRIHHVSS